MPQLHTEESKQKTGSGLRERILKGIGAQGFTQVVQVFIRLAEVPLLLSFWGAQLYGEWLMLAAIPAYISISDGGFATAACREMTIRGGASNKTGVRAVFQATWLLLIAVSIAVGLVMFGFVQTAPLGEWFGFSTMKDPEIKIVLLLLVIYVLVGFQGGLLNGGFWVMGRYSNAMYFVAVMQFFEFGGLTIAVVFGGGPIQAACGYLSGRLLGTGLMWLGQRRVCPWLRHGVSYASFLELRRLVVPALASLSFPLGNALNIQGLRLVVGLALGPSAVAIFVPLRTLSRIVMQPGSIINRLVEPELALAFGADNISLFRLIFTRSCQYALWGCIGVCILVGISAHWIFPVWTGGKVDLDWPIYVVLLVSGLINGIWYTALMVPYSTNRLGRIALFYAIVYGVAVIGLGYLWATRLGIGGAALALLMAEAIMAVVVINVSSRMACIGMVNWIKSVLRPPFDLLGKDGVRYWQRKMVTPE